MLYINTFNTFHTHPVEAVLSKVPKGGIFKSRERLTISFICVLFRNLVHTHHNDMVTFQKLVNCKKTSKELRENHEKSTIWSQEALFFYLFKMLKLVSMKFFCQLSGSVMMNKKVLYWKRASLIGNSLHKYI